MSPESERLTCEYCGEEFRGNGGLRIHQSSVHDEKTSVVVPCNWCGTEIDVREWKTDQRHYCSRKCRKAWTLFLRKGERHPNYVDGQSRGRMFRRVAFAVRKRDGECLHCGAEQGASNGRSLDVHHIVPEAEGGSHEPENLLSLCTSCHRKLEGLPPEEQLDACDISDSDLKLPEDTREWLNTIPDKYEVIKEAPDPRPGMFAEAQRLIEARQSGES